MVGGVWRGLKLVCSCRNPHLCRIGGGTGLPLNRMFSATLLSCDRHCPASTRPSAGTSCHAGAAMRRGRWCCSAGGEPRLGTSSMQRVGSCVTGRISGSSCGNRLGLGRWHRRWHGGGRSKDLAVAGSDPDLERPRCRRRVRQLGVRRRKEHAACKPAREHAMPWSPRKGGGQGRWRAGDAGGVACMCSAAPPRAGGSCTTVHHRQPAQPRAPTCVQLSLRLQVLGLAGACALDAAAALVAQQQQGPCVDRHGHLLARRHL